MKIRLDEWLKREFDPRPGDLVVYQPYQDHGLQPPMLPPDMTLVYQSGATNTLPRWSVWQWISECWPFNDCGLKIAGNSPYVGYSAFLLKRASDPIANPVALAAPSYEVGPITIPDRLRAGADMWVDISIKNTGSQAWPVAPLGKPGEFVNMSYAWLNGDGNSVMDGDRVSLPVTVLPGDTTRVRMLIHAPMIRGQYTLAISPVQEGVAWFYKKDPDAPGAKKKIDLFQSIFSRAYRRIAAAL
jgi:hypothetical protein